MKTPLLSVLLLSLAACKSPSRLVPANYANVPPATLELISKSSNEALELIAFQARQDLSAATAIAAAGGAAVPASLSPMVSDIVAAVAKQTEINNQKDLFGTKFGVGPAWLFNVNRVKGARIEGTGADARVRVTDRNGDEAALVLEWHHLFGPFADRNSPAKNFGIGPFAALAFNTTETEIGGLGAGVMTGWRFGDEASSPSFNIGYGWLLLNDVDRLPSGFVDGAAPPPGISSVNTITEDETVEMILLSFRWNI